MSRRALLIMASVAAVVLSALVGARGDATTARVTLRLTDAATGKPVAGIVRVFPAGEKAPLKLAVLVDRLRGLGRSDTVRGWYVVPAGGAAVELPRGKFTIEALSGLETTLARRDVDLSNNPPDTLDIPLTYLFRPAELGLVAGNTHLHLRSLTRAEADEYLRTIPVADGISVQFISYLERAKEDATYVTNEYSTGDLTGTLKVAGVLFNNGEEYRHNFGAGGQGYGHVMFLNLKDRILPASLGPGIAGKGTDDVPLRGGIDAARRQGATVLWCHNTFGFEGVPSVLAGRVDALNVFDGSRTGTWEDKYYQYLNVGLRLPVSTGTDWFAYDFSRDYVAMTGPPTIPGWLEGLKAGRCVCTNGPLLTLTVDGQGPGSVLALDGPRKLKVEVNAVGRQDFEQVELVMNGKVIAREPAKKGDGGHRATLSRDVTADGPAWLAARVSSRTRNEFGETLFAHTSPVYVDVAGRRPFDVEAALTLLKTVETAREEIPTRGKFEGEDGRKAVLAIHDEAVKYLTERLNARK